MIVAAFFKTLANLLNVIEVSSNRREMIRENKVENVVEALKMEELKSGSGLKQELGLKRPDYVILVVVLIIKLL